MKCKNCGKKLPFGVSECDNCGAPMNWKKYIWMTALVTAAAVLLVAAVIGAITRAPGEDPQESTGAPTVTTGQKTPSSQTSTPPTTEKPTETTKPSETTQPPTTQPTEPPTQPTELPTEPTEPPTPAANGRIFVYDGTNPLFGKEPDLSECVEGYFYYINYDTEDIFLICEDPVTMSHSNDYMVFYIKEGEPNRIYATPKYDFSQHTVIYESDFSEINFFYVPDYQYENSALAITEGSKQLVWLDLATGTATVIFQQYYLTRARVSFDSYPFDGKMYATGIDRIIFTGKLSEDDEIERYFYFPDTGEIEINDWL